MPGERMNGDGGALVTVVGGTGMLGRRVVLLLMQEGHRVRVVARSPGDGSTRSMPPGAEFVAADVRVPATLRAAVAGSTVVVSAVHGMSPAGHGSPRTVDREGNVALFAAARDAGAAIVMLSVVGASPGHPMELFRAKWAAEQDLVRKGPAAPARPDWTIVRATAFAELWLGMLADSAATGGRPLVFGRGENPVNVVRVDDVAMAVAMAATDDRLRGQVLTVVGPADLTMNELAALVHDGAPPRHVPRPVLRIGSLLLRPVRPGVARLMGAALAMDTHPLAVPEPQHPIVAPTPVARTAVPHRPEA